MSKQLNSEDRRTEIALFRYTLIFPMLRETSPQIKYQLRNKIADGRVILINAEVGLSATVVEGPVYYAGNVGS